MHRLAALFLLLVGAVTASAQWQVFAEKLPRPGTWATYRMETFRDGKEHSVTTLRFSVQPGAKWTASRMSGSRSNR
jgi:hypothetical protein